MIRSVLSIYLFASVIALSIVFVYAFSRGKSTFTRAFGLLVLTADIYLLGYLLEINVESLNAAMFWNQVQYIGLPFFPGLWLLVCLLYTERLQKAWVAISAAVFVIPAATFILRLTNAYHGLFYSAVEMKAVGGIYFLLLDKGPWYYVQITYILVILILCAIFYYRKLVSSTHIEKRQFQLLFGASIIPFASVLLIVLDPGSMGIDYTALALPPCILLINHAVSSYNFLELKVFARERVFAESSDGLVLMDRNYVVKDFNASGVLYFSYFNAEIRHTDLRSILTEQQDLLDSVLARKQSVHVVHQGEDTRFISFSTQDIGIEGALGGILLTVEDITVREELTRKLQEMAQSDPLTKLSNRRHFVEEAEKAVARALRYNEKLAFLMMDIDEFKRVNDTYGHSLGDTFLTTVARVIQSTFRSTDIVGRIGGEEFAVVMLNTSAEEAFLKAEDVRSLVEGTQVEHGNYTVPVTISIGVAELSAEQGTLDALVASADAAMYKAKQLGRNRTVV